MRDLFPGYYIPTETDFNELWREATFAFDASVLLGLYRMTGETRQVFFDVLQKLGDRIFLPNRAAHEYLRNRLTAISARLAAHETVKADTTRFARGIEDRIREHSIPKAKEILEIARDAEKKINEMVDASIKRGSHPAGDCQFKSTSQ